MLRGPYNKRLLSTLDEEKVFLLSRHCAVPYGNLCKTCLLIQKKAKVRLPERFGALIAEQHELEQRLTVLRITPLLTRAREARERWVGLPFTLYHEGQLWSGHIDLAFIADDAWSIGYFLLDPSSTAQVQVTSDVSTTPHSFTRLRLND